MCPAQECVADLVSLGKGSVCTMWREGKKWGVLRVEWRECFWGPASPYEVCLGVEGLCG